MVDYSVNCICIYIETPLQYKIDGWIGIISSSGKEISSLVTIQQRYNISSENSQYIFDEEYGLREILQMTWYTTLYNTTFQLMKHIMWFL